MKNRTLLLLASLTGVLGAALLVFAKAGESWVDARFCEMAGKILEDAYAEPVPSDCPAADMFAALAIALLWLSLALLIAGLCREGYLRFAGYRRRRSVSRARERLTQKAEKTVPLVAEPLPDLRLKNLFFHISPDCLGGSGDNALKIGADILQNLSAGKIVAWGRAPGADTHAGLMRIPQDYWKDAMFDYAFFVDDACVQVEPLPGRPGLSYCDLHFDREQVDSVSRRAAHKNTNSEEKWWSFRRRLAGLGLVRSKRGRV
jgi:hypothetical protein